MLESTKPGILSEADNDGSQIQKKFDRDLIMESSLSVPVAKAIKEDVSCLPSKHVVSPFYLVYFTNTLF
jgi:hypothetical protein